MPLVDVNMSVPLHDEQQEVLAAALAEEVHHLTGKPREVIMVSLRRAHVMMGASSAPAAWIDYRSIGSVDPETNKKLIRAFSAPMEKHAGVSPERLYMVVSDVAATSWGWNNRTFG